MKTVATLTLAALSLGTLAASASIASAHTYNHSTVDKRQANQWERIQNGRNSGAITWREGIKLRRQQAEISRVEAQFKADGRLTRAEKNALDAMQDNAGRQISREASDGWHRAWWLPRFGR